MTAQHGYRTNAVAFLFLGPNLQKMSVCVFQRINDKARKEEVIRHIPLLGDLRVYFFAVAGMNFGKKRQAVPVGEFLHFLKKIPCAGNIHKVVGTRFFGRIGEGV